jgi:micrococcal nuclease
MALPVLVAALVGCAQADGPGSPASSGDGEASTRATAPSHPARSARPGSGVPRGARAAVTESVTDGDTIVLSGVGKSRLIGVDTPEVYGGAECFGREASAFTKQTLPAGSSVRYTRDAEPRDRYGRALLYVWQADGRFFNARLVREGYAVPLTIAPNVRYEALFRRLARGARRRQAGLWSPSTCAGDDDRPAGSPGGSGAPDGSPEPSAPDGGSSGGGGGDRDCSDFSTQQQAQDYFESNGGPASDPDRLDGDGDGEVCESLP